MDMESFLDATVRAFEKTCPSLFKRADIAIRSRIKYAQLKRDEPPPPEQVYTQSAEEAEQVLRKRERWKRNLGRYAKMYKKARVSGINMPYEDAIDQS